MATISQTGLTLMEQANRTDPQGNLATIAEVLDATNEILVDPVFVEANDTWSNQIVRRASLPSGTWRGVNEGVAREVSQTITVNEKIGILESRSAHDVKIIDNMPGGVAAARTQEAMPFIEGLGQSLTDVMIYGNASTSPKQFNGLATRLSSLGDYAIGAGGTGSDVTSIYVVQWSPNQTFMCYPRGGQANLGITHQDLGTRTVTDSDSLEYEAYIDLFTMETGLCVKDARTIGRIANIETSGTSNIFDEDDLITLLNRMPQRGKGAVIYMNETVHTQMQIILKDKTNLQWAPDTALSGQNVLFFEGKPVRIVDQIVNTETAIS